MGLDDSRSDGPRPRRLSQSEVLVASRGGPGGVGEVARFRQRAADSEIAQQQEREGRDDPEAQAPHRLSVQAELDEFYS